MEADQQPVRLRRVARPKSVGRRHGRPGTSSTPCSRPATSILLISWKDAAAAQAYEDASAPNDKARVRRVRIVRDYGKYDRREAPPYYADAKGGGPLDALHRSVGKGRPAAGGPAMKPVKI